MNHLIGSGGVQMMELLKQQQMKNRTSDGGQMFDEDETGLMVRVSRGTSVREGLLASPFRFLRPGRENYVCGGVLALRWRITRRCCNSRR